MTRKAPSLTKLAQFGTPVGGVTMDPTHTSSVYEILVMVFAKHAKTNETTASTQTDAPDPFWS